MIIVILKVIVLFFQNGLVDDTTTKLGLHNLLQVSTGNADRYLLTRKCCYVFHCMNLKVGFNYPQISNQVSKSCYPEKQTVDREEYIKTQYGWEK